MVEKRYELTPRQDEAFTLLTNKADLDLLYGGAKGGGKSFLLCLWSFYWVKWLVQFFGITTKLQHPLPVGFLGRKRGVDFGDTTLETWKKVIPNTAYHIREQDKEIIVEDKVKMFFGGLDDEKVVNKFNSAELAFFAIDQAEETVRSELSVLQASLRLKYNTKQPPYKRFYTANPADCWLKPDFIVNPKSNHHYIPALPTDNPHLPANYLQTLENAFSYDPVLLAAYKEGNWDLLQSHATLISDKSLDELQGNTIYHGARRALVSCDPAIGGDECVLKYFENDEDKDQMILHINDTQRIGAEAVAFMNKHRVNDFVCDAIGIGKGVVDYVANCGKRVHAIVSSESATNPDYFSNRRSEMWAYVATKINRREIPYPSDEKTRRQLCAVRYKTGTRKFELVKKDIIKKESGESPDRADCFVMGIWYGQFIEPEGTNTEFDRQGVGEAVMSQGQQTDFSGY